MTSPIAIIVFQTVRVTIIQLIGVLGIFFVLGYILAVLQKKTSALYQQAFGWRGILWTAIIGTPVHEIGHVFFAKLFRHKIEHISLFTPNKETGGLGHVDHSYKKSSIYQTVGNFFVGAAPLIFGIAVITLLIYVLLPTGKDLLATHISARESLWSTITTFPHTLTLLFKKANLVTWQFWIFLYISFAISTHIAPSKQDRKGMWKGFFWIILILFFINLAAIFLKTDITTYILRTAVYMHVLISVTLLALLMSVLHYGCATLILSPLRLLTKQKIEVPPYDEGKNI